MNPKIVVQIKNNKVTKLLRNTIDKDERRKIIKKYLNDTFSGKTLSKTFADKYLLIKNSKKDNKHLTHNEHLDTSLALTQVEELILYSTYFSESKVCNHKTIDYFWYFEITVMINNQCFKYNLNIGRNKNDGHILLY